jgi:hypothetical protein
MNEISAEGESMTEPGLPRLARRIALVAVLGVLATAAATYAAGSRMAAVTPPAKVTPVAKATLVVPDVRHQAFVFTKGALEDAGFSWRVTGAVHGYSANVVASQSPAAGLQVMDNGRPTITLTLQRNPSYTEAGSPQDHSFLHGTPAVLADVSAELTPNAKPSGKLAVPVRKPGKTAALTPPAVQKPAAKPAAAKPAVKKPAAKTQSRPPAFVVPGARKEPLDEMPLTNRAKLLGRWLSGHPAKTPPNVHHWLYQHSWIVTGARLGWWHGAEALKILIADDAQVASLWGIGARSSAVARAALTEVEASSR